MPRSPSPRPGVASSYLKAAANEFEQYAGTNYVKAISDPAAAPESVLAGLRFITTRKVNKQYDNVMESLTIVRGGYLSDEIQTAGVAALLATSDDLHRTARFLVALAGDEKRQPIATLGAYGLREIGPVGREALVDELGREAPVAAPKKLARLLMNMSKARPPVPIGFWSEATPPQRADAAAQWRNILASKNEL